MAEKVQIPSQAGILQYGRDFREIGGLFAV
jgi:hypothetical protein